MPRRAFFNTTMLTPAESKRSFAYIDGANLHKGTVELGWYVDYSRFYIWLHEKFRIEKAYIFIGHISKYESLYSKMRTAGFVLVFKEITLGDHGQVKGNCDADLVLYAIRDFYESSPDQAVFVSSDGDFTSTISFLMNKGLTVRLVSPSKNCSLLLLKTNVPLVYLNTQRDLIRLKPIFRP